MYIYGCITPRNRRARIDVKPVATRITATAIYGALETPFVTDLNAREIRQKIAEFLANSNPTVPCVVMHIIHLARSVMHECPMMCVV